MHQSKGESIREFPDYAKDPKPGPVLQVIPGRNSVRVRADFGYRDFTLDGVSVSEDEDLEAFYNKFVEDRIKGVKLGYKCTIMMYGPTGSGKSYTMFGCSKQAGIVCRSLRDILEERDPDHNEDEDVLVAGAFVQVTVLEMYSEEIYDLLSSTSAAGGVGF
ncbi:hypothetical protein MLD38_027256 [Melastoma candidum]|uniref:Uncharacterized protein n=1 Tax=Melastoma candidum TaxID=119954 RepID=A0ACB9P233_9MYRT|nr:hypothetical protein MLD38_027256 [Melastoma candidum]